MEYLKICRIRIEFMICCNSLDNGPTMYEMVPDIGGAYEWIASALYHLNFNQVFKYVYCRVNGYLCHIHLVIMSKQQPRPFT